MCFVCFPDSVDTVANHVKPYWPAEPPTASESEEPSGIESLRVETKVNVELHQDVKENGECPSENEGRGKEDAPPSSPDSNQPEKRRGGRERERSTTTCSLMCDTLLFKSPFLILGCVCVYLQAF